MQKAGWCCHDDQNVSDKQSTVLCVYVKSEYTSRWPEGREVCQGWTQAHGGRLVTEKHAGPDFRAGRPRKMQLMHATAFAGMHF